MSKTPTIDAIMDAEDFSAELALKINSQEWSNPKSKRFLRFANREAEVDILAFYHKFKHLIKGPLLDIGVAGGHNSAYFAHEKITPVYAVDVSEAFLELAKKRAPSAFFYKTDMEHLPDIKFGTIIARGVYHLNTTQGAVRSIMHATDRLADGGLLYIMMRDHPDDEEAKHIIPSHQYTRLVLDAASKPVLVRNYIPPEVIKSVLVECGLDVIYGPEQIFLREERNRSGMVYVAQKPIK